MKDDNLLKKQCKSFIIAGMSVVTVLMCLFLIIFYFRIIDRTNFSFFLSSVALVQISIVALLAIIFLIFGTWLMLQVVGMQLARTVYTDKLTGGMNAEYFKRYVKEQLKSKITQPMLLQYFEIANLKQINMIYGRFKGDSVLRFCIDAAKSRLLPDELCVRLKENGFIWFGHNDINADDRRNEYILSVNERCREAGIQYPIRMRFGIYRPHYSETERLETLMERAEAVCPKGTDADRDLVRTYTEDTEREINKIRCIERDKEKGIERKEFKVWLQPKWDFSEKRIAGAEAVTRWDHPEIGEISPDDFVPVFEKNGFMEQLDLYVMEAVANYQGRNKKKGIEILPISINQSKLLFFSPQYVYKVRKILKDSGAPKTSIQIEMKEVSFRQEKTKMSKVMTELSSDGVQFIVDDFCRGNSLATLKDLEFDTVKFDKDFFQQAANSPEQMFIVSKIVEMVNSLGIEVACEGVEDAAQARAASSIGCRYAQGFWYSKPITLDDFRLKYCKESTI